AIKGGRGRRGWLQDLAINLSLIADPTTLPVRALAISGAIFAKQPQLTTIRKSASHDFTREGRDIGSRLATHCCRMTPRVAVMAKHRVQGNGQIVSLQCHQHLQPAARTASAIAAW